LFVLSLLALREAFDRLIRGNMKFPTVIDRAGSAFLGLIASLVVAGVIALGFQLLPISPVILGFDRCAALETPGEDKSLFPKADNLVVGLAGYNSKYGFSGQNLFDHFHPSFLRELYMNRMTLSEGSRQEAAPNAVHVTSLSRLEYPVYNIARNEKISLPADESCLAVTITITSGSDNKQNRGARDSDGQIRFLMGNIQLLGFDPKNHNQETYVAYPLGVMYPAEHAVIPIKLNEGRVVGAANQVQLLFGWPSDLKKVPPQLLKFKGTARAALPPPREGAASPADPQEMYKNIAKETQAALKLVNGGDAPYRCEKMTIIAHGDEQPAAELLLPSAEAILKARGDKSLITAKPEVSDRDGYHQSHVMLPAAKPTAETAGKGLAIPDGFVLVLVKARDIRGNSFFPPIIADEFNTRYESVGWSAAGRIDNKDYVEFAYDAKLAGQKSSFEGETLFKEKKGDQIDAVFFFLVPDARPMGLVGCSSRKSGTESGVFFAPDVPADMLLISPH
jgi:hypothetical protein